MAQFSRIKIWVSNEVLFAADLNNEFTNLLNGFTPSQIDGASGNPVSVSTMRSTSNPGLVGTESPASNLLTEIQQMRYVLQQHAGTAYWYVPPTGNLQSLGTSSSYVTNVVSAVTGDDPGIGGYSRKAPTNTAFSVAATNTGTTNGTEVIIGQVQLSTIGRPFKVGLTPNATTGKTITVVLNGPHTLSGATGLDFSVTLKVYRVATTNNIDTVTLVRTFNRTLTSSPANNDYSYTTLTFNPYLYFADTECLVDAQVGTPYILDPTLVTPTYYSYRLSVFASIIATGPTPYAQSLTCSVDGAYVFAKEM